MFLLYFYLLDGLTDQVYKGYSIQRLIFCYIDVIIKIKEEPDCLNYSGIAK